MRSVTLLNGVTLYKNLILSGKASFGLFFPPGFEISFVQSVFFHSGPNPVCVNACLPSCIPFLGEGPFEKQHTNFSCDSVLDLHFKMPHPTASTISLPRLQWPKRLGPYHSCGRTVLGSCLQQLQQLRLWWTFGE